MYQVQQLQQSPSKITGSCYRCHKPGHWANSCPESPHSRSPISRSVVVTSDDEFPATHCRCGAGLCIIKVSGSASNPNRKYYNCPGKYEMNCKYFKWCDQLKIQEIQQDQPKSYPICGCGAGVCSVKVEENGVNAGRSYYACPIKKGDGACNFRQWLDNPLESASVTSVNPFADQSSTLDEFEISYEEEMQIEAVEMVACETPQKKGQVHMDGVEDETLGGACWKPGETLEAHPRPVETNVSDHLDLDQKFQFSDTLKKQMDTFQVKDVQGCMTALVAALNNRVPQDSSTDALKYLMADLLKQLGCGGQITSLYSEGVTTSAALFGGSFLNIRQVPDNLAPSNARASGGHLSNQSSLMKDNLDDVPDNLAPSNARASGGHLSNQSSLMKDNLDDASIMKGNILLAFERLAQQVQDELITLLESMSPHNHETMRKEADCTFQALNCLQVDYGLFQLRVNEYIKQAASLAHIEQTTIDDMSCQELVNHCTIEQRRFNEILSAQHVAREAYMASNTQLNSLIEKISCPDYSSAELAKERSSCEEENAVRRETWLEITRTMTECKQNLQVASQKAAEALKKSGARDMEWSEANAAFQKVRAQLRN